MTSFKYGMTTWPDVTQDCNSIFMQLLRGFDTFQTISLDPDTFGTTLLLIWQILTDRTKMLYLCPMSISISVPFTPHLPQFKEVDLWLCCCCCECQKNTNRHYSTRPVCVSTLIPFYSIHKCVVACMSPSVCCEVIVVMSAPWSVQAAPSLNKVMRSKLNSAMSVPVSAGSTTSAHTGV